MLIYFVIIPILIAVFLYLFPFEKSARILAIIIQSALLGAAFYLFYESREQIFVTPIGYYESVLGIILRADTLTSSFILLTAFIFLIVAIYSYSDNNSRLFWFLLFIWEGTLIGIFLAGDVFNVFVLTEVATMVVSVLIMYYRNKRSMYDGIIYLMINIVAIQFYLFGLGYLYRLVGVLDMETAAAIASTLDSSQLVLPYALIMTFIALKCALLPLFSWLPRAHSTPGASPGVSAVLSGLHIKGGVYLLLRFQGIFEGVASPEFFLAAGIITAFAGVIMALSQNHIKRILAYSTIAQVGVIIAGLHTGNSYNYIGSLYHIFNHAIFKAALFLSAGIIANAYDTKDITKISGVLKQMPVVGIASIMAVLGITGAPFFNGSVSKYFIMYDMGSFLNALFIIINLGTITIFIKYSLIFFGKPETEADYNKYDLWKQVPVMALGLLCLGFGIFGESIILYLLNVDVRINMGGYIEKSVIFGLSLGAGFIICKYGIKDRPMLKHVAAIDLGFRGMCAALGVFFAAILITVRFIM